MQYGICNLSIVPVRMEPNEHSEMTSQLLYGEHFKVLECRKYWSRIRVAFDKFEGWIANNQYLLIEEAQYSQLQGNPIALSGDLVEVIYDQNNNLLPVPLGSQISAADFLQGFYDGSIRKGKHKKEKIIESALMYLNSPFLWGGKTPFGIDSSGFTQMVYKLNGHSLKRTAAEQSQQGEALSFIEESDPGDLAFFDDDEGQIVHVGLIMHDHHIIHSYGKVRIDRIDHTGIFNTDTRTHTHKLRVIKRVI
ncbi:C40 family peptidase [Robertkochia aurantiaca]|uniref:C40 family peptidase n=1 Tax=Robertkochia aurantiaca TaxID=2873700 RepID=UPI001CCE25DA|nr:NlpC/P60 family protein [Robertkochia sp. 3YJGBD-33]